MQRTPHLGYHMTRKMSGERGKATQTMRKMQDHAAVGSWVSMRFLIISGGLVGCLADVPDSWRNGERCHVPVHPLDQVIGTPEAALHLLQAQGDRSGQGEVTSNFHGGLYDQHFDPRLDAALQAKTSGRLPGVHRRASGRDQRLTPIPSSRLEKGASSIDRRTTTLAMFRLVEVRLGISSSRNPKQFDRECRRAHRNGAMIMSIHGLRSQTIHDRCSRNS